LLELVLKLNTFSVIRKLLKKKKVEGYLTQSGIVNIFILKTVMV